MYRGQNSWSADWIGAHTWNARGVIRHRRQHHEVRLPGRLSHGQSRARRQRHSPIAFNNGMPNQLTRASQRLPNLLARPLQRALRAGPVDARPADAAGRRPLRPFVELLPRTVDRRRRGSCRRDHLPGVARASRATTTSRRGSGVAYDLFGNGKTATQVQHGPVSGSRGQRQRQLLGAAAGVAHRPRSLTRTWTDANGNFVTDCDLINVTRRTCDQRRRFLRRDQQPELRQAHHSSLRSASHAGLGRPAGRLADRRHGAARDPAARLAGSRLHAPLAPELHRHRQPGHSRGRLHTVHASRRSIRGCPAAAATSIPGLYRRRADEVRDASTTTGPTRPTTVTITRSTTAWTST